MPRTDAQKRAQNKYDAANYTMIGCKVRRDYADAVRRACAAAGITPAAAVRAALDKILLQYNNGRQDPAENPITHDEL